MYDYRKAMLEDIKEYIREEYTLEELKIKLEEREALEEELNDQLWYTDSVTGNASGSYTFDRLLAREYVTGNTDILQEAIYDYGMDYKLITEKFLHDEWEYFDITIRCYLLSAMIYEVLNDLEEELINE